MLIPGSVGGAAVQNIGAYGIEAAERIDAVEIFDLESGEFRTLSTEECDFGYRSSVFKSEEGKNWVIVSVTFRLPNEKDWTPVTGYKGLSAALEGKEVTPRSVLVAVEALRRAKLPDRRNSGTPAHSLRTRLCLSCRRGRCLKIIRSSLLTLWGDGGQSSRPGGSLMPPDSEAVFWGTPRSGIDRRWYS